MVLDQEAGGSRVQVTGQWWRTMMEAGGWSTPPGELATSTPGLQAD